MKFLILIFLFKIVIDLIECQPTNPISDSAESYLINSTYNQSYPTYNEFCGGNYKNCINNLECKNLKCKCPSGHIWSNSTKKCLLFSQQSCNHSIECQDSDPIMVCSDHKCRCSDGYELNNSTQLCKKKFIGSFCVYDYQCRDNDKNMVCSNGHCKCLDGYIFDHSTELCKKKVVGSLCVYDNECQYSDPNMVCSDHKCQCQSGYQIIGKKCYQNSFISKHYGVCSYDYVCNTTLECFANYCYCPVGKMWSSELGQCISMSLGYCKSNFDCQDRDIHMKCSYSKCQCEDGYEINSLTKLCKKKKMTIGSSCSSSYQCQHDDLNMVCSSYGQCKCSDEYEFDYNTQLCKKKKMTVGSSCSYSYQCQGSDLNMVCSYGQCKCSDEYDFDYYTQLCKEKVIGSSCSYDYECPGLNSYCSYGICLCEYGYKESASTCIRDYTVDLYNYNYSYWNILWIPLILGFIVALIRLCIICSTSTKRTSQVHVTNTPANNSNTITPGVPFVYNPNPSSTVQLSCTQPPLDCPPKYEEVASMNQQRNN